jgi:hypothetical protein
MNLWISETYINVDTATRFGDSGGPYETFTDDVGKLYRSLVSEYGRCVGKVRIDPDGRAIGWVFRKRMKYEDTRDTYIREVWVTLHDEPDTVKVDRTHHYHYLPD